MRATSEREKSVRVDAEDRVVVWVSHECGSPEELQRFNAVTNALEEHLKLNGIASEPIRYHTDVSGCRRYYLLIEPRGKELAIRWFRERAA